MTPFEWVIKLLDAVGSQPSGRSPRQCPAHRDAAPSLSLHERQGKLMLYCHAGCTWREILHAVRCNGRILRQAPERDPVEYATRFCQHLTFPKLERGNGHPALNGYRLEAVHDYGGHLLERWRHQVTGAKDLMWWTRRDGITIPGLMGVGMHELPLYREAEVRAALAMGEPVLLIESESSVDALRGWAATTWAGGANAVPAHTLVRVLGDGTGVVVIPDVDIAGLACAHGIIGTLPRAKLLVGTMGEDAKDLYGRVGKDGFATMIKEVMA